MDKWKNFDLLNTSFMSPEEINFIFLEPSLGEIASSQLKENVRSEMVDILKNDLTGTLLLPFIKPDYR